jgi:hypothetical protein
MRLLKKLIVWCCVAGVGYFLISNHLIFVGSNLKILKKTKLSMDYTLFSTQGKTNESILSVDVLRKAGIGQILVETGKMSQEELESMMEKIGEAKEEGK